MYCTEKGVYQLGSLISRPSYCSVFDHIQYVEMEGRGLEAFVTLVTSRVSDWKNDFESFFSVLLQVLESQTFVKWKSCHSLFMMENTHSKVHCFSWAIGKINCVLRFEHQHSSLTEEILWTKCHGPVLIYIVTFYKVYPFEGICKWMHLKKLKLWKY